MACDITPATGRRRNSDEMVSPSGYWLKASFWAGYRPEQPDLSGLQRAPSLTNEASNKSDRPRRRSSPEPSNRNQSCRARNPAI
jgi:hypothetical protein